MVVQTYALDTINIFSLISMIKLLWVNTIVDSIISSVLITMWYLIDLEVQLGSQVYTCTT